MATTIADLWSVILLNIPRGERLQLDDIYTFVERNSEFDEEDLEPSGPNTVTPRWKRNVRHALQIHKQAGEVVWFGNAQYLIPIVDDLILIEKHNRQWMWENLILAGGPNRISPDVIKNLRMYEGQAGVFRDAARTTLITGDEQGLTVSVLHKGTRYSDDLTNEGVVYHYPETQRIGSTDHNEIEATKNTAILQLPVFVITTNEKNKSFRDVRLSFITGWDDNDKTFNILFSDNVPENLTVKGSKSSYSKDIPFSLDDKSESEKVSVIPVRPSQTKFKKEVFERYGASCAVCDLSVVKMLDAAHIKGKKHNGSDDPRNGLVLCASHHRAMDAGLFAIDPTTLEIVTKITGPNSETLRITRENISHMRAFPHVDALSWLWEYW